MPVCLAPPRTNRNLFGAFPINCAVEPHLCLFQLLVFSSSTLVVLLLLSIRAVRLFDYFLREFCNVGTRRVLFVVRFPKHPFLSCLFDLSLVSFFFCRCSTSEPTSTVSAHTSNESCFTRSLPSLPLSLPLSLLSLSLAPPLCLALRF